METLRAQTLKYIFQIFFSNLKGIYLVYKSIYFCMILCACLQVLYKLIQLSLRYNKGISFNVSKFYSEHFTTTDSKLYNILKVH